MKGIQPTIYNAKNLQRKTWVQVYEDCQLKKQGGARGPDAIIYYTDRVYIVKH